jgi:hypothetical protein
MRKELSPLGCERDRASRSHEEAQSQRFFQLMDRLSKGGLGEKQALGRSAEMKLVGEREERP